MLSSLVSQLLATPTKSERLLSDPLCPRCPEGDRQPRCRTKKDNRIMAYCQRCRAEINADANKRRGAHRAKTQEPPIL